MGATVHLHYCMDKVVGWSLVHDEDDTCGKCGMEEKDRQGCCKDEQKQYKLKADQQKAGFATFLQLVTAPVITSAVFNTDIQVFFKTSQSFTPCHAPPDIGDIKLHLLHRVFLV